MIIQCSACHQFFDDEFRSTLCPHETFPANDGCNRFAHHPESYLAPFDADLCNVLPSRAPTFWRVLHHVVAHPLLGLSGGARWAWQFHDWTLPLAWPAKEPIPKRKGLA